jgi:hypothetical protein
MKKIRNELKDLKIFGMTLAAILMIFGVIHFMRHRMVLSGSFIIIGLMVLCVGILLPGMLRPLYAVFLKAAHAIGWFNTRVILVLIFFLIITPIGIIMRIFTKDQLNRKIDKGALSYWIKKTGPMLVKEQLEKQF